VDELEEGSWPFFRRVLSSNFSEMPKFPISQRPAKQACKQRQAVPNPLEDG
jgi:hypothetical protein